MSLDRKINSRVESSDLSKNQEILAEQYELILKGHTSSILTVAIASDNKYIISGSEDRAVRVWNVDTKTEQDVFKSHSYDVASVAITSNTQQQRTTSYLAKQCRSGRSCPSCKQQIGYF
jgi:WD40 repeat protein